MIKGVGGLCEPLCAPASGTMGTLPNHYGISGNRSLYGETAGTEIETRCPTAVQKAMHRRKKEKGSAGQSLRGRGSLIIRLPAYRLPPPVQVMQNRARTAPSPSGSDTALMPDTV